MKISAFILLFLCEYFLEKIHYLNIRCVLKKLAGSDTKITNLMQFWRIPSHRYYTWNIFYEVFFLIIFIHWIFVVCSANANRIEEGCQPFRQWCFLTFQSRLSGRSIRYVFGQFAGWSQEDYCWMVEWIQFHSPPCFFGE